MRKIGYTEKRETLADHFVAAFISAFVMLITVALGPFLVGLKAGRGIFGDIYLSYGPVHIWGALLIGAAFLVGLIFGPKRMAEFYGHLWGTEQPERPWLTLGMWGGVLVIISIGFWLRN